MAAFSHPLRSRTFQKKGESALDELDSKILEHLDKDCRQSLQAIGKKLKVSEGTIRNRLFKMETDGLILRYSLIVDPGKLGFKTSALIGLTCEPAKFFTIIQELKNLEDVRSVTSFTGQFPIIIEVWKKDSEEMGKFIADKINPIPGISGVSPNVVVERHKYSQGSIKV